MIKSALETPVRRALRKESSLLPKVKEGMGAVEKTHRDYFDTAIRQAFADSLNADEALRAGHDQDNRWDYILGHRASQRLVGVEPHSAKEDEVSTIIRKRTAALQQLQPHLREGEKITKWLWVASGRVFFANTEKTRLRLDQNGIEFVGTRILSKHLPIDEAATTRRKTGKSTKPQPAKRHR